MILPLKQALWLVQWSIAVVYLMKAILANALGVKVVDLLYLGKCLLV
jgi:hypothetical protein